jgi:uncharacterized protein YkwD
MHTLSRRHFVSGLVLTGGAFVLSGCTTSPVIMTTERATPVSSVSVGEARAALNAMRREKVLPELVPNAMLQAVAEEQAGIMARTTKVAHTAEAGEPFIERLRRAGFWGGAGENLAGGPPNLATAIHGWMKSSAHHKVMVNPDYVQFGIAIKRGPATTFNTYGTYWALIMGVRSPDMAQSA